MLVALENKGGIRGGWISRPRKFPEQNTLCFYRSKNRPTDTNSPFGAYNNISDL